jgi:hypothetical protein
MPGNGYFWSHKLPKWSTDPISMENLDAEYSEEHEMGILRQQIQLIQNKMNVCR